jgi:MYND finger
VAGKRFAGETSEGKTTEMLSSLDSRLGTELSGNILTSSIAFPQPHRKTLWPESIKRSMICAACGKPPVNSQKLLICRGCQCAVYHDAACQRQDWKRHKKVCASLGSLFIPMRRIMTSCEVKIGSYWWETVTERDQELHELCWLTGYRMWCQQENYLEAMKCFQDSLAPYSKAWDIWNKRNGQPLDMSPDLEQPSTTTAASVSTFRLEIAKRLLFCAYCEIDGQLINSGRHRLVQCLSVLLLGATSSWTNNMRDMWDDTWMELVLSLEEDDEQQPFAKFAAALALDQCRGDNIPRPCGWTNAWQRPGYMSGYVSHATVTGTLK